MRVRVIHKYGLGAGEAVDHVNHGTYVYVQWYSPSPSTDDRPKWVFVRNVVFRVPCGRRVVP